MKHAMPIAIAVLLTGLLGQPAAAQTSGLTNADVVRLVAARVPDQTVITVIQEAAATRFDLSSRAVVELAAQDVSSAVITAMRQVPTAATPQAASTTNAVVLPDPAPAAAAQTLAGAAAEAALTLHTWPVPATSPSELPEKTTTDVPAAPAIDGRAASAAGEASWRARVAPLHQALREDRAKEGPLLNRINKLSAELAGMAPASVKRRGVESERQKLTAELTGLHESLRTDLAATQTLEDEGRRAGVPPEWLR
jgi:hypothetical protein